MIKIKIFKKDNEFKEIELNGHSGYAESGQDIVCAAVSTLAGALLLGVQNVAKVDFKHLQNDEKGYFSLLLNSNNDSVQAIFKTTVLALEDLAEQFPKHIAINLKEA